MKRARNDGDVRLPLDQPQAPRTLDAASFDEPADHVCVLSSYTQERCLTWSYSGVAA